MAQTAKEDKMLTGKLKKRRKMRRGMLEGQWETAGERTEGGRHWFNPSLLASPWSRKGWVIPFVKHSLSCRDLRSVIQLTVAWTVCVCVKACLCIRKCDNVELSVCRSVTSTQLVVSAHTPTQVITQWRGVNKAVVKGRHWMLLLESSWGMEVLRYTLLSPSLGAIHAGSLGFNFQLYTNLYWPLMWKLVIDFKAEHMVW